MHRCVRIIVNDSIVDIVAAVACNCGGVLERGAYLVDAGVRAGNEPDRAQRQRDAVHDQTPAERAVAVRGSAPVTGDGHVAQRRKYQRQKRTGHRAHHRYEQVQVWYHVGRYDCSNNNITLKIITCLTVVKYVF